MEEATAREFGEAQYRTLVESIRDFAIFHLDREGRVMSWNQGARQLFGYEANEIIGESSVRFFTP
jgi:PAS domain S-box-containing protein